MSLIKKQLTNRLNIIEGQIKGLKDMVQKDKYCIDIITQTAAAKQALSSLENVLMENHLGTCVVHQIRKGKQSQAINEVLKVYRLKATR